MGRRQATPGEGGKRQWLPLALFLHFTTHIERAEGGVSVKFITLT
jgi:hypothetical protein